MKKIIISSVLVGLIALGVVAQKGTKEPKIPAKKAMKSMSKSLTAVNTALSLIRYGYDNNCATCLVSAADILSKNPTSPLKYEKLVQGKGSETKKTDKKATTDVKTLLNDAVAMDKTVSTIASTVVVPESSRGAVSGPRTATGKVAANSQLYYDIRFYENETATVAVVGDGDTDLDLYVYDLNGNLITKDDGPSDRPVVSFVPYYRTTFRIYVTNRGSIYNRYALATN